MDKHKIQVAITTFLTAAGSGAVTALLAHLADPTHFNWFDLAHIKSLAYVAVGGAVIGVLNLFRNPPRNPAAYQRADDPAQVIKAAEKLGIVEPPRLARGRRQTDMAQKSIARKADDDIG